MSCNDGLGQNCNDIRLAHHEVLLALELQLGAGILAIQHGVTGLQHHLFVLGAFANGNYFTLKGLLFGGVGDDDAADGLFFCCSRLYQNAVCKGLNLHNDLFLLN